MKEYQRPPLILRENNTLAIKSGKPLVGWMKSIVQGPPTWGLDWWLEPDRRSRWRKLYDRYRYRNTIFFGVAPIGDETYSYPLKWFTFLPYRDEQNKGVACVDVPATRWA